MGRILFIEDSEVIGKLLREGAENIPGIDLDLAETMEEGLRKLAENEYETCLLDLELPDSSKEETLKRIPAIKLMVRKVVVFTGWDEEEIRKRVEAAGAEFRSKHLILEIWKSLVEEIFGEDI